MSAAVRTATTPGAARAAAASIATMRAWAWSLRRNATCSAFAAARSSTKRPQPRKSRGSSLRLTRAPMSFGRRSSASVIGVGAFAQGPPLAVVMAADDGRAGGGDAPDLGERFVQRGGIPDVARDDARI